MQRSGSQLSLRRMTIWSSVLAGTLIATALGAQSPPASRAGRRRLIPPDSETALARSAAPLSVSEHARILIFSDTGYVIADSGTSTVTCVVNRSWPTSLEPHCYDAEASATVLPIELRRTLLYHQGYSEADVARQIGIALERGIFRLPRRPAMSWMMSDAQRLVDDDGHSAGHWRPHIMVYYPYLSNRDAGFSETPDLGAGMVADAGTALSSLLFMAPSFVTPHFPTMASRAP
jgi:hypothetical protein